MRIYKYCIEYKLRYINIRIYIKYLIFNNQFTYQIYLELTLDNNLLYKLPFSTLVIKKKSLRLKPKLLISRMIT